MQAEARLSSNNCPVRESWTSTVKRRSRAWGEYISIFYSYFNFNCLIEGGKIDPLVEGSEVDKADKEGGVDQGVGHRQEHRGQAGRERKGLEGNLAGWW